VERFSPHMNLSATAAPTADTILDFLPPSSSSSSSFPCLTMVGPTISLRGGSECIHGSNEVGRPLHPLSPIEPNHNLHHHGQPPPTAHCPADQKTNDRSDGVPFLTLVKTNTVQSQRVVRSAFSGTAAARVGKGHTAQGQGTGSCRQGMDELHQSCTLWPPKFSPSCPSPWAPTGEKCQQKPRPAPAPAHYPSAPVRLPLHARSTARPRP